MEDFMALYVERQEEWSRKTFGPGLRTKGIIEHIRKELSEIADNPLDLEEWIDVIILGVDGYWRHGGDKLGLTRMLQQKQDKNFARKWPPIAPEDQAVEHIR